MNTFSHLKKTGVLLILMSGLAFSCHHSDPEPEQPTTQTPDDGDPDDGSDPDNQCTKADATVSDFVVSDIDLTTGSFTFSFALKNTGHGMLYPDRMSYQTFLSTDTLINDTSLPSGGSIFSHTAAALSTGQSLTVSVRYTRDQSQDLSAYKYVLIQLKVDDGQSMPECRTDNNLVAQPMPIDIPRDGLVAFYAFTGSANDVSGNHLDGTPMNAPQLSTDRFGHTAHSYLFDGVNDYITMGNPPLLQISDKITVSGWFNAKNNNSDEQTLITKIFFDPAKGSNPTLGYTLNRRFAGDDVPPIRLEVFKGDLISMMSEYVGLKLAEHQWTFFCFVIDGTGWKFYKNGVLSDEDQRSNPILTDGSRGNLDIGTYGGGSFFDGWIDDLAIYNRALTDAEVTQLFRQTITQ